MQTCEIRVELICQACERVGTCAEPCASWYNALQRELTPTMTLKNKTGGLKMSIHESIIKCIEEQKAERQRAYSNAVNDYKDSHKAEHEEFVSKKLTELTSAKNRLQEEYQRNVDNLDKLYRDTVAEDQAKIDRSAEAHGESVVKKIDTAIADLQAMANRYEDKQEA